MSKTQLTVHFTLEELSCKCKRCNRKRPPENIVDNLTNKLAPALEKFRVQIGTAITVTSGYRCPEHNAECEGSAKNSFHMQGLAADLCFGDMTEEKMFELASLIKVTQIPKRPSKLSLFTGVGYYKGQNFVHVDVAKGKPRPNTWKK